MSLVLAEDGEAVAGGVYNPSTDEIFLGTRKIGVTLIGVSGRKHARRRRRRANHWALRTRPGGWKGQPCDAQIVNAFVMAW